MRKHYLFILIFSLLQIIIIIKTQAQESNFLWAKQAVGSIGINDSDQGKAIATDASGNTYITGYLQSSISFSGKSLTGRGPANEVFVAKYDALGTPLWVRRAGGEGEDQGNGIAVDGAGNVYVTGAFSGSADFGNVTLYSSGGGDAFIAKYDASGNLLWARNGGGSTGNDTGTGITVDAAGNAYITGMFFGSADFGGTTLTSTGPPADMFIAKYDAFGNLAWARQTQADQSQGQSAAAGWGIAVDAEGNPHLTGQFWGTVKFGPITMVSTPGYDMYVAKYDAMGTPLWVRKAGGAGEDVGNAIALDASGNSFVAGSARGAASFGSESLTAAEGQEYAFLAKYGPSGDLLWAKKVGEAITTLGQAVATDDSGNAYLAGLVYGDATFGGTALPGNSSGAFIAKYGAATGEVAWAKRSGDTGYALAQGVAVDAEGNAYMTGYFDKTVSFGSTTLSSSGREMFITKVTAETPLPVSWISFTGKAIPVGNELLWSTASEKDAESFVVERSFDGKSFLEVGRVAASGNSNQVQRYRFLDVNLPLLQPGVSYYRLRQLDFDGQFEYSKVIAVSSKVISSKPKTLVSPNPFTSSLTLHLNSTIKNNSGQVRFFSADGREVYRRDISELLSSKKIMINGLPNLAPGVYILRVILDGEATMHKLVRGN